MYKGTHHDTIYNSENQKHLNVLFKKRRVNDSMVHPYNRILLSY